VDVSARIADEAARIRSETGLKLPDAIVAATGTIGKAECIVTNDIISFRRASKFIRAISPKEFTGKIDRRSLL